MTQLKSPDIWKGVEHFGRDDVIQRVIHMLTLKCAHGHLG